MLAMSKTDVQPGSTETQQLRVMVSAAGVSLVCLSASKSMLSDVSLTLTGSRSITVTNRFHFWRNTIPRANRFLFSRRSHGLVCPFFFFLSFIVIPFFVTFSRRRYPFSLSSVVKSCASRFHFPRSSSLPLSLDRRLDEWRVQQSKIVKMLLSQGAAGQESKGGQDCKRKAKDNKEASNVEIDI